MNLLATAKAVSQEEHWSDWQWHQRNATRTLEDVALAFPDLKLDNIARHLKDRKVQITPYFIELIRQTSDGRDVIDNPLARQVLPYWESEIEGGYDAVNDNWELKHEMKTPICQHKYDNRVILRIANVCNAYCQFCFEALRTIDLHSSKQSLKQDSWGDTVAYIKSTPSVEEVILSGGEPLMIKDEKLERYLSDLRRIRDDLLLRIHSRILSFNPFRVTDALRHSLEKHRVNSFGVHVCHPAEITPDFISALRKIQTVVPITFANIPLLRNINDNYETLTKLFFDLYRNGVVPYYLYHYMPLSPGSSEYGSSIASMIKIMKRIKRRKSNIAVPEYVLPHVEGKYTVPLIVDENDVPRFSENSDGAWYYNFRNWQGKNCQWREYQ